MEQQTQTKFVEVSEEELAACVKDSQQSNMLDSNKTLFVNIVDSHQYTLQLLQEKDMSLLRLRKMLAIKTEHKNKLPTTSSEDGEKGQTGEEDNQDKSNQSPTSESSPPTTENTLNNLIDTAQQKAANEETTPKKGHGRHSADEYRAEKTIIVTHKNLKAGDNCPHQCGGKLSLLEKPQVVIKLIGTAPIIVHRYERETFRCNLCRDLFAAPLPKGITCRKNEYSAIAMIAVLKYLAGMPFYRLERLQEMAGVPLADATQWGLVKELVDTVDIMYQTLITLAAQAQQVYIDDTDVRILSLMKENKEKKKGERRGMFTTGIVAMFDAHKIYLYFSGRQHAGENLSDVLSQRNQALGKILQMSDALSRNLPEPFETLLGSCLVHGRRKFYEIYDYFPGECRLIINALAVIYINDAYCKENAMDDQARLLYHQEHSGPIMDTLKAWLDEQINEKKVEPNSSLGKAIRYMIRHWSKLTLFLRVAGAPLDNNIAEQALKIPILGRKNYYFYKTEKGAQAADVVMSIGHTAAVAGVNPIEYLTALQENAKEMGKNPLDWLPWNYKATLAAIKNTHDPPKKVATG